MMTLHSRSVIFLAACACLAAGCGAPGAAPAGRETAPGANVPKGNDIVKPEYSAEGQLTRLSYDKNNDGKPDTWGYMDGARVVRVEVDENADGTVDRWEFHAGAGCEGAGCEGAGARSPEPGAQRPDQTIERIERATRHDGTIDRREFFEKGALVRVEEDTDADGKVDKWETYKGGTLSVVALDTSHTGTPDRRLLYADDGSFLRVENLPAGAGKTGTP